MSGSGYTVEVTNLSSSASENDLHEFFSFSGPIEHIDLIRSGGYGSTAYVTFKEPYALETAVLLSELIESIVWAHNKLKVAPATQPRALSIIQGRAVGVTHYLLGGIATTWAFFLARIIAGATIVDQPVCISRWGQPDEPCNFWDRPTWQVEEEIEYRDYQSCQFNATPQEALTVAQDVVKTMLARGYILSKDALSRARAFDESHQLSGSAAAKAAELSRRLGLTDRVSAGVGAIRSVDETYHVTETTKTVATATGRTAVKVMNTIVTSSYFSAGAMMVSEALTRAAKAAENLAAHGRQN